ncbi:cupin domain-containing protein, partial [Actinomadura adrarensis]
MAPQHPRQPQPPDGTRQSPLHAVSGLLAGIGLSQVRVYSSQAPDGQCSGTPHLHLACTELYFPLRGGGAAEFLTPEGPSRIDLHPGVAVQFTPGTLHRLITGPDPLEILVIMENGRLNEEGDVVFTFPDEDLAEPDTYAQFADTGSASAPDRVAIERRRDRAVTGFVERVSAWRDDPQDGLTRLRRLYRLAAALVAPRAA